MKPSSLQNPVISAYLQCLLLTGARPGEVMMMRWQVYRAATNALLAARKVTGQGGEGHIAQPLFSNVSFA
jgi:hypothetical protein